MAASHFVLFGPPAAGKGTQAARLVGETGKMPTSTGELLRKAVADGTKTGKRVGEIMNAGGLVDDATIMDIIRDYLDSGVAENGALFDGFPRTVVQAKALDVLLRERGERVSHVVNIRVPDGILLSRVKKRIAETPEADRRADDSPQTLKERLVTYHEQTTPVLRYYQQQGTVFDIDGTQAIDEVTQQILQKLT